MSAAVFSQLFSAALTGRINRLWQLAVHVCSSLISTSGSTRLCSAAHTMYEFWFFSLSSSLLCCLRNRILWTRRRDKPMSACVCVFISRCVLKSVKNICLTSAPSAWPGSHTLGPGSAGSSSRCRSQTCTSCPCCGCPRVTVTPDGKTCDVSHRLPSAGL